MFGAFPGAVCAYGRAIALDRLVAVHRDPVYQTVRSAVVGDGVMLGAAVVPNRNGVLLPMEAGGELRRLQVIEEIVEEGAGFLAGDTVQPLGEDRIDIERLAPRLWVGADDRMLGRGNRVLLLLHRAGAAVASLEGLLKLGESDILNRGHALK